MNAEESKSFETEAVEKLRDSLSTEEAMKQADSFAKMQAYETYEPVVEEISPAYKVKIDFQDEDTENAVSAAGSSVSTS